MSRRQTVQEKQWGQEKTIAGKNLRRDGRPFVLKVSEFSSTEQGVPIRVFYGTVRVAAVIVTPIFEFKAKKIKAPSGK